MKLEIELSDQAYQEITGFLEEYTQENKMTLEPWLYDRLTMLRDKLHAAVAEFSKPSCENCEKKGEIGEIKDVPDYDKDAGEEEPFYKTLCKQCAVEEFSLVSEEEFDKIK